MSADEHSSVVIAGAWEVRDGGGMCRVQRGDGQGDNDAGLCTKDYGLACAVEAILNLRDGTVE